MGSDPLSTGLDTAIAKQKDSRFRMKCHAHTRLFLKARPRHLVQIGSLLLALLLITPPGFADQAAPQTPTGVSASADGSQMVTLMDGSKISLESLWQQERQQGKSGMVEIADATERRRYALYKLKRAGSEATQAEARLAEKDAELAAQKQRIADKKAALAQLNAMIAAVDELSNSQLMLDFSPKAKQRRMELAAVFDAALNNPHINKITKGTRALLQASADLMREGKSPGEMGPRTLEEINKLLEQEK